MIERFAWHDPNWHELIERKRSGRFPHALLFNGAGGTGKAQLALALSHALLCQNPAETGEACGQCKSCLLIEAGSHPDLLTLTLEEDAKDIKIAQVRELMSQLALTSQYDGYKIAIIWPAERMNINSANSLLKTLEEPADNTLLILVTAQPSRLLPTIRSRCQQINFTLPPHDMALQWLAEQRVEQAELLLALADGAPLLAAELGESEALEQRSTLFAAFKALNMGKNDPISVADIWGKSEPTTSLRWLMSWVMDMIRLRMGGSREMLANPDIEQDLQRLAEPLDLAEMFKRFDQIAESLRLSSATINQQLLLEETMMSWARNR
ncbi:DNA polymerase III subunit delta' [Solemya pervernicosa gill symbiont]|uniref:DNA polymerase III subunit delta' n=2 Tax=Gammaproteobacteria incertae sedis TaxID=118884 RepID=A0A1T2L1N3_9GAMM|nr:DNA polymerase III subunit delta' [Candidatus Reidiella endopervernicosa]OOZ39018.1 DNA polymerase III subunit delta' [Solemya pervernicosa gill symbiont]QKQ26908.1 DNA polymerase III subunit delta' [Candidatus Reidiella endopervernicosa]